MRLTQKEFLSQCRKTQNFLIKRIDAYYRDDESEFDSELTGEGLDTVILALKAVTKVVADLCVDMEGEDYD